MSSKPKAQRGAYHVKATRSGDWWALTCDALPGFHSQARRYREVEQVARDGIALLEDVDPDSVIIVPFTDLGLDLEGKITQRRELLQEMEAAQRAVAAISVDVLRDLAQLGLTQRDAADVLGISFQRVSQLWPGPLVPAPPARPTAPRAPRRPQAPRLRALPGTAIRQAPKPDSPRAPKIAAKRRGSK